MNQFFSCLVIAFKEQDTIHFMRKIFLIILSIVIIAALIMVYFVIISPSPDAIRTRHVITWIRGNGARAELAIKPLERCDDAPFILPTYGLIGYVWDDSFRPGHHHQGIDIFAGTDTGITPVYAAYGGYLTRQSDWKSSVIIRIPSDPLEPGRQIWTYYTHMADAEGVTTIDPAFPPGTHEIYVKTGTLLGYQGSYSGSAGNPVGVHLHFSIVKDDGTGNYLNELEIGNTIDPSTYLGLDLNANNEPVMPIVCKQ